MRNDIAQSCLVANLAALLRTRWVVVFGAYWDETWTENKDVFAVAGYIFSQEDSARFCQDWNEALDFANLKRFHMTDFLAKTPPYDKWREPFRLQFFNRLVDIIYRNIRYQIIVLVSLEDLKALSEEDRNVLKSHTEYSMGSTEFCAIVRDVIGKEEPIAYIYDGVSSDIGLSHVVNEFQVLQNSGGISSESFIARGSMVSNPELQAADILVHECANEYSNMRRYPDKKAGRWGRMLFSKVGADRNKEVAIDSKFLRSKIDYIKSRGGITIISKRPPKRIRRPASAGSPSPSP